MARSRLQLRREAEAAEGRETPVKKSAAVKKKAAKAATKSRKKVKPTERKRLVWALYSNTLKEEGRFPYDQRKEADEKLEQLLARGKKLYFLQAIKEPISGEPITIAAALSDDDDVPAVKKRKNRDVSDEEE
ncbi:MAG: hypothetical protein R3C01_06170 [Planctomycetaceae bacterium]